MSKFKNIYNTTAFVTGHVVIAGIIAGAAAFAGLVVASKLADRKHRFDDDFDDIDDLDEVFGPDPDEAIPAPGEECECSEEDSESQV